MQERDNAGVGSKQDKLRENKHGHDVEKIDDTADRPQVVWGQRMVVHLEEARQVVDALRRLVVRVAWLVAAVVFLTTVAAQLF
ncbi:hypothetical protein [Umezawaea sp. NPDC059074]|uniref:hypothetical protein n=1 Tax=Umezawaea sp. NPDC059074 TaxID=3346716 RepID=UPI0036A5C241